MPLVFAAITPHPPLLIPTIGKEAVKQVEETRKAMEKLEENLYASHPDVIFIISPHGSFFPDAFTINACPEYETDLRQFGDLATKMKIKGEVGLSYQVRMATKRERIPATMISEPILDHGSAVPLFYLLRHLPDITLLQFGFCALDRKKHLEFGRLLKEQIMTSNKRVAVVASGDMSHALTTDAPAGFNPAGPEFDRKIQELLAANNVAGILQLDERFVSDAAECGLRSILILLGVLQRVNCSYRQYAYEAPFGVGYLTAEFIL